jgi:hypothetical protein
MTLVMSERWNLMRIDQALAYGYRVDESEKVKKIQSVIAVKSALRRQYGSKNRASVGER